METKQEDGVEEVIKQLEKKVNQLLEESAAANCERKYQLVGLPKPAQSIMYSSTVKNSSIYCVSTKS